MPVCHEGSFYWEEIISSLPRFHRVFSLQDVMGYIHQDAMGHIQFLKNIDDTVDGKVQLTCWYGKYPISYRSLYTPGTPGGFLAGFLMNEARSYKRFSLCCYSKQPESPIDNQNPSPLHPNPSTVQDSPVQELSKSIFRSDKPWITSWPYTSCMQPGVLKTPKNGCKRKNGRCFLKHNKY